MRARTDKVEPAADKVHMEIFGIAQQGLERAQGKLEATASRVARSSQSAPQQEDLSTDMVSLSQAHNDFLANVRAIQTGDQMQQKLLDILA